MNLIPVVNIFIAPFGFLFIVFIDYLRNKSTDVYQRKLFFLVLGFTALTMACEIIHDIYAGRPGAQVRGLLYAVNSIFFLLQAATYNFVALFMDYTINTSVRRNRRLVLIMLAVMLLNLLALVPNGDLGYYFQITQANEYAKGTHYWIRMMFMYFPIIIFFIDYALCWKNVSRHQMGLIFVFCLPGVIGGAIDMAVQGSRLLWPGFTLSLLFGYLFIIRSNYGLDSLTGIDNRHSFDAMLTSISRMVRRKSYGCILIDLDHFKQINDSFGHAEGDNALKDTALILKSAVRKPDFVARYGGDEFIILIEGCEKIEPVVERIRRNTGAFNRQNSRPYVLKMSIGYDLYLPDDTRTPQKFIEHVDALMYADKRTSPEARRH